MATGLELPAAIIGVSGALGTADIIATNIVRVYKYIGELKDVPNEIQDLRAEIQALENAMSALDFIKTADATVQAIAKKAGLPEAIRDCGVAAGELEKDIQNWTARGEDKLRSKMKVRANRARVAKYRAKFTRAREFAILALGTISLQLAADQHTAASRFSHSDQIRQVARRAEASREQVEQEIAVLARELESETDDLQELDINAALVEKRQEEQIYVDLRARTATVARGIVQKIGNVKAGDLSDISVGMPAAVVEQMSEQTIGDTTIGDNATGRVGIFK